MHRAARKLKLATAIAKEKKWSDVFKNVTKFRSVTQTKCNSFLNKIVDVGFRKRKLLKIYFIHQICILSPHSLKEKTLSL